MYQRSDRKNERRIFTMNIPNKNELTRIYGEAEKSAARFQAVADHFAEIYHHDIAEFFTAPGRTEIIGNHTCYQRYSSLSLRYAGKIIDVYDNFLIISFTCDTDNTAVVRVSCTDGIHVNTACDYATAIMILPAYRRLREPYLW